MAGVCRRPRASGRYRAWYVDERGVQRSFVGTMNWTETLRIAKKREADALPIRLKFKPAPKSCDAHGKRPFSEVAAEFAQWGRAQGGHGGRPWAPTHARMRERYLAWWGDRLGLATLGDLAGIMPRVEEALREVAAKGRSGKTIQSYADGLKAFTAWCTERGYLSEDPLRRLRPFDGTPVDKRRAATLQEVHRLLESVEGQPERWLLYATACTSGLRAGELRALQVKDLDAVRWGLGLDAAWTKNRRPGFQPIPSEIVRRLVEASAGKQPGDRLLTVPLHTERVFARDAERAGIQQQDFGGRLVFHSLRKSYGTFLDQAGATVKEAEMLLRHRPTGLSYSVYIHASEDRLRALVEAVGEAVILPKTMSQIMQRQAAGAERLVLSGHGGVGYNALQKERSLVQIQSPRPFSPSQWDIKGSGCFSERVAAPPSSTLTYRSPHDGMLPTTLSLNKKGAYKKGA